MVGRPSRRFEIGLEALSKFRKWLGGPLKGPEVVGRPSRWSESGRKAYRRSGRVFETLPEVRKWSSGPPEDPEVVVRPFRRSGSGWESLL